jgi:hypothetical protein
MRQNTLENAAKYALMIMKSEEERRNVSLGFSCAVSMLKDALGEDLTDWDDQNLFSVGVRSCQQSSTSST